jgi:hypothetical protein
MSCLMLLLARLSLADEAMHAWQRPVKLTATHVRPVQMSMATRNLQLVCLSGVQ